ncbi:hypothetical protein L7F22_037111 [Adiantum nelumboides]|nr:hypothetical protein [Adiantum nelumboides]
MYTKCGTLQDACSIIDNMPRKCVVTWTAIITGFAQNGNILQAYTLFRQMQHDGVLPNIVTWNAMLAGAAEHGYDADCLHLFQHMQDWGIGVDDITFVSILKACGSLALLNQGLLVHCFVIETTFEHDLYVCNTLIDMYVKCGSVDHAYSVFNALPKQKVEAWNAMQGGCYERVCGQSAGSIFFEQLQQESTLPGLCAHMSNLPIHASISALNQERLLCTTMAERSVSADLNAAVCNRMENTCNDHQDHFGLDLQSCGDRGSGFTHQSNSKLVMDILHTMQAKGSKPDDVTFISLLSSCCEMGLLHEGCQLFSCMTEVHGITPKLDHFNCLVSLVSNAGCWNEAEDLLQTMPLPPDIVGWTCLLCRSHGNVDLGERCFAQVISLNHRDAAGFQQMSSMYADAGLWEGVDQVED